VVCPFMTIVTTSRRYRRHMAVPIHFINKEVNVESSNNFRTQHQVDRSLTMGDSLDVFPRVAMAISTHVCCSRMMLIAQTAEDRVESLVREHAAFVFRVAYSVLRDHYDAEDAAQETFLRVLRHRSELAGIREPRAWLARIAFRIALNKCKSRRSDSEYPAEALAELAADGMPVEEIVHRGEMKRLLEKLIAALPADLRDVLRLSTIEELTSAEIGTVLEIPDNSVRTRLHRARQLLREKLESVLGTSHE
jgi:RNA polymerase sigma-70 factor (ECF subfamily)